MGQVLCKECFFNYFQEKIRKTFVQQRLISKNDRVAVALSGGKDSTLTLYILNNLRQKEKFELFALIVDEGIRGYREKSIELAVRNCEFLGVNYHIVSFKDFFGFSLDEVVNSWPDTLKEPRSPCTFCGVFRRRILNNTARELNATKIATGHNLDDNIQTLFMNVVRGDVKSILKSYPERKISKSFVKRIKPLANIPEKEIAAYVLLKKIPVYFGECPYSWEGMRNLMRETINSVENFMPGAKINFYNYMLNTLSLMKKRFIGKIELKTCEICGEPSSHDICKACQLVQQINNFMKKE